AQRAQRARSVQKEDMMDEKQSPRQPDASEHAPLTFEEEAILWKSIGCGIEVHRRLGRGFKEKIYHEAYRLELSDQGMKFESEKPILVRYKRWEIPGQRIDLIIEGIVLVEIKAVPRLKPFHQAQVVSYLKTMNLRAGLLLNFHARL